jgi:Mrp family chromosome partitioning ATPase
MSRNFELLCQLHRERELFHRALPEDAPNSQENDAARISQIEKRLFEEGIPDSNVLAAPGSLRNAGSSGADTSRFVQQLFLAPSSTAPRAVVFSPVDQNYEHHAVAAQVADLLGGYTQESICLVDANFANPSLHSYFGVENEGGLAGALLGPGPIEEFTKPLPRGRLSLMPAGRLPSGADLNAILASGRLRERLADLGLHFNFVVVAAPPATSDFITSYLAALTDGLILVVEPRFTPRQAACDAKENVQAAGGRVLGVVLHKREVRIPNWLGQSLGVSKPAWNF